MSNLPRSDTEANQTAKLEWVAPELQRLDSREATAAVVNNIPDGQNCS